MDTQRFSIELTKSEIELLRKVAKQERRPMRDQAAWMLSQILKEQDQANQIVSNEYHLNLQRVG